VQAVKLMLLTTVGSGRWLSSRAHRFSHSTTGGANVNCAVSVWLGHSSPVASAVAGAADVRTGANARSDCTPQMSAAPGAALGHCECYRGGYSSVRWKCCRRGTVAVEVTGRQDAKTARSGQACGQRGQTWHITGSAPSDQRRCHGGHDSPSLPTPAHPWSRRPPAPRHALGHILIRRKHRDQPPLGSILIRLDTVPRWVRTAMIVAGPVLAECRGQGASRRGALAARAGVRSRRRHGWAPRSVATPGRSEHAHVRLARSLDPPKRLNGSGLDGRRAGGRPARSASRRSVKGHSEWCRQRWRCGRAVCAGTHL